MMVSRAIEFSKHQCLPQRICSAQTAENWCGSTDRGVTTGIEVGRIRHVRLSTIGSNATGASTFKIGPLAHNILKPIPLPVGAFKFSTNHHPPTCLGSSMRMILFGDRSALSIPQKNGAKIPHCPARASLRLISRHCGQRSCRALCRSLTLEAPDAGG